MSWLNKVGQLLLPGFKKLTGVKKTAKEGLYTIEPENLSEPEILEFYRKRLLEESNEAAKTKKMSGYMNSRHAGFASGALNNLKKAAENGDSSVRGALYIDPNGRARGAASIVKDFDGGLLPDDLDFTKASPNYLSYVAKDSDDVYASDLLRALQELYGDRMVFQIDNPGKNVAKYKKLGAEKVYPKEPDDLMPTYELNKRVQQPLPEHVVNPNQARLFRKGGLATYGTN